MDERAVRALVREAVARHMGRPVPAEPTRAVPMSRTFAAAPALVPAASTASGWAQHPSHVMYLSLVPADEACVIEPAVSCDHCGYCKSHGH